MGTNPYQSTPKNTAFGVPRHNLPTPRQVGKLVEGIIGVEERKVLTTTDRLVAMNLDKPFNEIIPIDAHQLPQPDNQEFTITLGRPEH
jgi:hypothetical protein